MHKNKLVKGLSQLNVFSLALGSIIGWGAFVLPGNLFIPTSGVLGTSIAILIGAIIMIFISYGYGIMINLYPEAGGEFVYTLKQFGSNHAFIAAWFLSLAYISIVPLNATALALIGRYMFPGLFQFGLLYNIAGWDVYLGEIILAYFGIIFFGYLAIKGVKITGKSQTILTLILVGSILLMIVSIPFSNSLDFNKLIESESGLNFNFSQIFAIVAIAPWAFLGFDTVPQSAEEYVFSPKKTLKIMITSIGFGAIIYIALNLITGLTFNSNDIGTLKPFWATGESIELLLGNYGLVLLGTALISAIFAGIIGFYAASSRLLFSMSKEGVLPIFFQDIDSKNSTPKKSIIAVMGLSLIAPWFGREVLVWIVDMASIGAAVAFFYTSIAALKFLYNKSHFSIGVIITSLSVLLSLSFFILLLVPGMPGFLSIQSRIVLVIWSVIGLVIFSIKILKSDI